MFGIGMPELLVILLICLLIFGADKLPGLGKALGKTISEFKKGTKEAESSIKGLEGDIKDAENVEKKK
ncbi:MAG: twin-arginine translocase TatA/TatE family subunit [Candidatus Omnitrophica bacterium]|nr:twin-arginine translocase TatA/TatE family subunit [Candidatus Omnitrophota bacterium]